MADIFGEAISIADSVSSMFGEALGYQSLQGLNENLFVTIQDIENGTSARGRIVSYSVSNQAEWANRFEGSSGDSRFPTITALLQSGELAKEIGSDAFMKLRSKTTITKAQSVQVWTGIQPQSIDLQIEFMAFTNAYTEVEAPIQELVRMQSPVLNDNVIQSAEKAFDTEQKKAVEGGKTQDEINKETGGGFFGTVPSKIAVSLFGKRFNATYRIESMEESVDEIKIDSAGNRIYQVVSLSLGSSAGIMKDDVKSSQSLGSAINAMMRAF